ncbi:MAG: putative phage protein [Streptosporangiaceae bacterium]|nr:putative phage protein [Streptosporangiaceae bacterium]
MAVVLDSDQWLKRLIDRLSEQRNRIAKWDQYYEGTQPLSYLAPELVVEMGDRLRPVIINWPRLVVDSIEEREDVEGFRLGKQADADAEMWRIWQANDLDEESQQAHIEALTMGRAYVIVGGNEDEPETPLITVESPMDVYVEPDPRTRDAAAAVKLWSEEPAAGSSIEHATLYLPDATTWYVKQSGKWVVDDDYPPDVHGLGQVPVVPLLNRGRIRNRLGVSELADVVPLSDAACKIATDMLVSAEFHAMPRRYAIGMAPQDFVDANGNPLSTWSVVAGRLWATEKTKQDGVDLGQFPEANLTNFHETINALARLVASMSGLDPQALGFTTTNPSSADAIRAAESRLIKRVRRKMRTLGGGWEQVMRIADRFATGVERPELRSMETMWADPETPTVAQSADAAVKKYQAGLVPRRQTREDLGYTQTQINRMEQQDAAEALELKMPTAAELLELRDPTASATPAPGAPGGATNVPAAA